MRSQVEMVTTLNYMLLMGYKKLPDMTTQELFEATAARVALVEIIKPFGFEAPGLERTIEALVNHAQKLSSGPKVRRMIAFESEP